MQITVGSLFDGIGGWCIAAERNGAAQSEMEWHNHVLTM